MTNEQKKQYAKILFVKEKMTQKEIAAKVETSEQTLSRWIKNENWEKLKQSMIVTRVEQVGFLYEQLADFNAMIMKRAEGERFVNAKESQTLIMLTSAIEKLEKETSIAEHINSFMKFNEFCRKFAPIADIQKMVDFQDTFIRSLL